MTRIRNLLLTTSVLATISGTAWAQNVNPNPFPPPSSSQQTQAPPTVISPNVTVQASKAEDSTLSWIWAALGAIFTALFGVNTIGNLGGGKKIDFEHLLNNPELRLKLDNLLLQVIQSGRLSPLVAQLPGGQMYEPIVRKVGTSLIEKRLQELEEEVARLHAEVPQPQ